MDAPALSDVFPDLSIELSTLLTKAGQSALAGQVRQLRILDRCRCKDDFCSTMYTQPKPRLSYGSTHRSVNLHAEKGMIILDVEFDVIACIEVLYRPEIRARLLGLFP